jgi:hypothetical protein
MFRVAADEYDEHNRDETNTAIRAALGQLNGSDGAALALMTGFGSAELDELGGLPR